MNQKKVLISVSAQSEILKIIQQILFSFQTYLPDLQANTLDLEVRVGNLEENSGDDGNSSITELELRVQTLEDTTADQETRIVAAEENIQGDTFHYVNCQKIASNPTLSYPCPFNIF